MEYVRVRDRDTGHHMSIPRGRFERTPEAFVELKQDATYADGTPRPVKHKTTVSNETAKTAAKSAGPEKEN